MNAMARSPARRIAAPHATLLVLGLALGFFI
jgi:hypothetical protein